MQHFNNAKKNPNNRYFLNAVAKHPSLDEWDISILETCRDRSSANEAEIRWIDHFDARNRERGYNTSIGGEGVKGVRLSEEHKAKLSAIQKKRYENPEERKKTSEAIKEAHRLHPEYADHIRQSQIGISRGVGRKLTETHKQNISSATKEALNTSERIAKISAASKRSWTNERKAKQSAHMSEENIKSWQNPVTREKRREGIRLSWIERRKRKAS